MTGVDFDFAGRVACVTGGARGIGAAVCERFAAGGAAVVVADLDGEGARGTAARLSEEYGGDAAGVEADVTDYEDASAMVEAAVEEFGGLDVLVNNAGVARTEQFADTDPGEWDAVLGPSLYGTLNCTHAALPALSERAGAVVNYASSSHRGNDPGLSVYGAAKAANVSFTKTLAKEVGDRGVRVNCVSPGTVRTPATADWVDEYGDRIAESYALGRIGTPEEVADAVAFLASDAAAWITGETLHVDGGYERR